jgi:hypothetical protein
MCRSCQRLGTIGERNLPERIAFISLACGSWGWSEELCRGRPGAAAEGFSVSASTRGAAAERRILSFDQERG